MSEELGVNRGDRDLTAGNYQHHASFWERGAIGLETESLDPTLPPEGQSHPGQLVSRPLFFPFLPFFLSLSN